jgi:hypothetical protein
MARWREPNVLGLSELQRELAHAMTSGDGAAAVERLRGGSDPAARLAIHLRHYTASLAAALCDKFPASGWLAGADVVRDAAVAYARQQPPMQPCIAEYGQDFPQSLARHPRAQRLPYLASFAELEWAVGRAAIAIHMPPASWTDLVACGADRLLDSTLVLQPGLHYVRAEWRIDELMQTYLGGVASDRFVLLAAATPLEIRGARGTFQLTRLDTGTFAFRAALAAGRTISDAADAALSRDLDLDPGAALRTLVEAGLVIGSSACNNEPLQ